MKARHDTPLARRRMLPAVGLAALAGLLLLPGCAVWRLTRSAELARRSEPYQQQPLRPVRRLLIVGDSTAVGTGASTPQASMAGLLGQAFPQLAIENRAQDGARMAGVLGQLQEGGNFDVVLVQAGGNDVIRLSELDALNADVERVARRAAELAPQVVLMPCGNVGNAPFFFAPVSGWMTRRSRALHRFVAAAAMRHGATYVNLFHERDDDPFVREPSLNASDGLHPSDSGYAVWWRVLQQQAAGAAATLAMAR
jgi:lysophospholipase L1-like esterase